MSAEATDVRCNGEEIGHGEDRSCSTNPWVADCPTGRLVAAHRRELNEVLRRHGVTNARIFGSVARGDDHEGSDLDLLVDFAPGTDIIDIIDIIGIKHELEDLLGAPVDLIPRDGLKERVRARVERDLVPL